MQREQWEELQSQALKAKSEFPNTVYVHSVVLPSGAILTVRGSTDRAANRRKLYPKMAAQGYKMGDFDEVCTGSYGSVVRTFFIPKEHLVEAAGLPQGTDPVKLDEVEFFGMTDIPDSNWYENGELNDGELEWSEEVIS